MKTTPTQPDGASPSPKRRYLALLARAKDQAGKPEGELCRKLADRMASKWPHLVDFDGALPEHRHEIRWQGWHERDLLLRTIKYCGAVPQAYTGSRRQVLTFMADEPTLGLIEQAFAQLRAQCRALLNASLIGFMHGAVPDPDPLEGAAPIEGELLGAAMAAVNYGTDSQPRKALGASS